jgi:DNA-directed RNA polymerase subunit RPC12/RpoP
MERLIRGDHPLLTQMQAIDSAVSSFRTHAKKFYFQALASRYSCPACGDRFELSGRAEAVCACGISFDPTLQFQKSRCCDAILTKRNVHYACSACNRIIPSRFLFDEKLFDQEYFRERMRITRERRQRQEALMREMRRIVRSDVLIFLDEIDLDELPGLSEDIDRLCGDTPLEAEIWSFDEAPSYEQYCQHISQSLGKAILFSAMAPLFPDERWDITHRFAALIFMEHHREINLYQLENDILVSRP